MTPEIFIGLSGKTDLHKEFNELIAKYGGIKKLVSDIESEMIKKGRIKSPKRKKPINPYTWSDDEIKLIKNNIRKTTVYLQSLLPNRSIYAIQKQRQRVHSK